MLHTFNTHGRCITTSFIVGKLFDDIWTQIREQENLLVKRNCELVVSNNLAFIFEGKVYSHTSRTRNNLHTDRLHVTLEQAALDYLVTLEEYNRSKLRVESFIVRCLNKSKLVTDFFVLFPDKLHGYIPPDLVQYQSETSGLSSEFAADFHHDNYAVITEINERLLINLLVKG